MRRKITIKEVNRPKSRKIKDEIRWVCDSLDLMKGRDIDDTSFKILCGLFRLFSENKLVSTEEVSNLLHLEPYKVNHHIRRFMESGLVFREKRKIALRGGSLSAALEELKRDSEAMFDRLLEVSKKIDKAFRL